MSDIALLMFIGSDIVPCDRVDECTCFGAQESVRTGAVLGCRVA